MSEQTKFKVGDRVRAKNPNWELHFDCGNDIGILTHTDVGIVKGQSHSRNYRRQHNGLRQGMRGKRAKYGNTKVSCGSLTFDSKKEMQRYLVLKEAQENGVISDLELQPTFELIPKVTERYVKHLKTKDKVCERTVQLAITYKGDFAYTKDGVRVVEDVKASAYMFDPKFLIKEKLFRWKYGFSIKRVYKANDEI